MDWEEMKHLLITLLALTCATLHAQSVVVYKTDAGNVRGKATASVSTVTTNLTVTGTVTPDVTGTYWYYQAHNGYPSWTNDQPDKVTIYTDGEPWLNWMLWNSVSLWSMAEPTNSPEGEYAPSVQATGTATVAYSIITNTTPATVIIHGIATP